MRQQIKKWASLVLSITLVLYSFGGCAKRERGDWVDTPTGGKSEIIDKNSRMYREIQKIVPDGMEFHFILCNKGTEETFGPIYGISLYTGEGNDDNFAEHFAKNEGPTEQNKKVWKQYVGFLKQFEKKILRKEFPENTAYIFIYMDNIPISNDNAPQHGVGWFDFNKTVDGTWSWRMVKVGDSLKTDFETINEDWKKLLDDKFITRHYDYGEEPIYRNYKGERTYQGKLLK